MLALARQIVTRARDTNPMRARREELGLMVTELAQALGRTAAFVSMCEGGFVPSQLARRKQIADVLQTSPEALWPEEYST